MRLTTRTPIRACWCPDRWCSGARPARSTCAITATGGRTSRAPAGAALAGPRAGRAPAAQGHQGRLAPVRAQLLPALPAGRAPGRDRRQRHLPSRLPVHQPWRPPSHRVAMRKVGWVERQVRRADRFQQRHAVIAFPWAVLQKFGNDQAGGKAALMAYYGLFALFPLLLLLTTFLGFALSGDPALHEQLIDSALGNFPVIGDQLRSEVHPLEGNTTALVIGIAGTLYGSLGIGFAAQNAMNTVWNIPYVRWPSFGRRYLRTFGVIGLLGLAVASSTALTAFATAAAHAAGGTVPAGAAAFP